MSEMRAADLYGLPLERFTAERAALAKTLRAAGDRDAAAHVAKLPKPSVAAWAVNQLVRTQPRAVEALLRAGDDLQEAQAQLLAGGGDPGRMRDAAERERAAVAELTGLARGLLTGKGSELSGAMLERVSETLHAAALDSEAREQIIGGCLARELRHVGLGGGGPAVAPKRSKPAAIREEAAAEARREREQRERRQAARHAEADARRAVERAERELRVARERRDKAGQALELADQALRAAEERAQEAEESHRRAMRALGDA